MHEDYMRMAIQKAEEGRDSDDGGPFGALIVKDDEIICQVYNLVKGEDDLTQHAELLAIQEACKKLGRKNLEDCVLYTSCEPCMMCLGACHWAKFKAIYYGASALDAKTNGFLYSDAFFNMDSQLKHTEFRMTQLLATEAVQVWGGNPKSEIEQLNSKIVYQNRWMTVREDRVKRRGGAEGIYGVVDKPYFVVIVPYENGKVHLVQQYRYPVQERFWEFPQGSWEQNPKKKPEQVAIGELKEETGLIANEMIYVGFQYVGYGYSSQGYYIYFATGLTQGEKELDAEEEDLISSEFTVPEFEKMLLNGEIKDATTTCAYALARMKGFIT